jgi:hypothetical protein
MVTPVPPSPTTPPELEVEPPVPPEEPPLPVDPLLPPLPGPAPLDELPLLPDTSPAPPLEDEFAAMLLCAGVLPVEEQPRTILRPTRAATTVHFMGKDSW